MKVKIALENVNNEDDELISYKASMKVKEQQQ